MSADLRDVLHTPYQLGGRSVGVGLDCLGACGEIARRRGRPAPDGWPSIRAAWERGEIDSASGFPAGWVKQPDGVALQDGDFLLYFGVGHPWCAIVDGGNVYSSSSEVGSGYCLPLHRWRRPADEVWRFQP